ncbi:MAG TPA: ribose-phosphate pyrophosphokinase [Phenylobacterium sp.]
MRRLLLALPGNEAFAARLAVAGGFDRAALDTRRFPDGERYVRIDSDVSGRVVDLVCTLAQPDDKFLTLAFVADTLRDLGAAEVNLVAPYLGYMRQDTRFRPGEAVTSRTFARLLSGLVDRLITIDPHLHRIGRLEEIYGVPCDVLHAAELLGAWVGREMAAPLIVGPDAESAQWASEIAARAGAPFVVLEKQRFGDTEVRVRLPDLRAHAGRRPVLVDDVASSGRTLLAAADGLRAQGFATPVCVVVHPLFAGDALERLSQVSERVVSTDTIEHPTNGISIVSLVAAKLGEV